MSKSLRIMHVIDSGGLYGAEKVVLSLMREHQLQGMHVELASIAEPGASQKAIEKEAARLALPWRRFEMKKGVDKSGMHGLLKHARDNKISLIHSHGYKANILLALIGLKNRRIPVISTLHGWTSTGRPGRMKLYEWAECALLPRLDSVVAVCEAMTTGTLYSRRLGEKLNVIPNGIPVTQIDSSATAADSERTKAAIEKFADGAPVFVMVGRLSREKDIPTVLRAIVELQSREHAIRIIIFGEGPDRDVLESLASELGVKNYVFFWGYCDCIGSIMSAFRGLIISSLTEGAPLVVLEAMRAGIPVIATRVGGLPEMVVDGKTGSLVQKSNPRQLADAIARLAADESLASELGSAGRKRLTQRFSISRVAEDYLTQYRALA